MGSVVRLLCFGGWFVIEVFVFDLEVYDGLSVWDVGLDWVLLDVVCIDVEV